MKCRELLRAVLPQGYSPALPEKEITGIVIDSRQVRPGFCFVAIPGTAVDGRRFIPDAVHRGAGLVVYEQSDSCQPRVFLQESVVHVAVPQARKSAAVLAAAFYDEPARQLTVTGITGTNGKTTTAFLLEHLLSAAGERPGLIGTVWYKIGGHTIPAQHTTPDAVTLQRLLADMRTAGQTRVVMEVSSHALDQGRVEGIAFHTAVFTNLTQDHFDYHKNFERYFQAKARLFQGLSGNQWAVLNADDDAGRRMARQTRGRVLWYGIDAAHADVRAVEIRLDRQGIRCRICTPCGMIAITSPLMGRYNVYNILAACAAGITLEIDMPVIAAALSSCPAVPGRLERVESGAGFDVFVDYAHTEDALRNVLSSLREIAPCRLLVVFGCGGDRDREKRPAMGRVAATHADWVTVTSDNPRGEQPQAILEEIRRGFPAGFKKYSLCADRAQAIADTLRRAEPGDLVLIAGKGHEGTQTFNDRTVVFDDRQVAREALGG